MTRKTILIAGYYGFENIGDEAILSSILSNLREQRRNLEFIVVSGNPKQTSKQYNVRSVLWTDIPTIMDACQESDLILLGGGGLFHDYWGTTEEHVLTQSHSGISFYSDFPILAKLYNKPCVLYSLGVGPLITEAGKKLTKQSFENASIATVRDIESFKLLQELGLDTSHVKITADSVFNLNSDFKKSHNIIKAIKKDASPLVAIGLRHWVLENASNDWQREIASALDAFTEKTNASFLFLPFQISPDNSLTDDLAVSQKIVALMKHAERAAIFQERVTPEIISGIIGQCDFVLGMRLHSLIFAVKEVVPFVGLMYDPKVENLISTLGMQEFSMPMEEINAEKLLLILDDAWEKREKNKKLLTDKSKQLKELAKENITLVLEQLDAPYSQNEMNIDYLQKLLLKQTRKLAEAEKTAHTLWLQTQEAKKQDAKPVQVPKGRLTNFQPSPAQLTSYRPDIICFSIIDWEFRYQRPQQIMSQFAVQGHRVFYISVSRFQTIDEPMQVKFIKENIFEIRLSAHHIPDLYGENISDENLSVMIRSLEQLSTIFEIKEAIGYVMIASWQKVAFESRDRFGWKIIYDCMDEWDNFPLVKSPIIDAELLLVRDCDLLVVTSQILFDKWAVENRPVLLARNAADYEFYEQYYRPNHLLDAKHPTIGYYGAIADWFDLELMIYIAKNRPEYTFVLLGGVFDLDVGELSALPNVMLLGQQPYETMPQFLYHFDVCIIPFKINPITEATDPVKIYEYMCGGKPVVSVALPEIMPYQELLYIAENPEDFAKKIDQALKEDSLELQSRRKIFAQQNSWRKRVLSIDDALQALVENLIDSKNPQPLIFSEESIISSRLLGAHEDIEYWYRIYEKDGVIYKQLNQDLAKREFNLLSKLNSQYYPQLIDYTEKQAFSVLAYKKIDGEKLETAFPVLVSSLEIFYNFISHCLNLLSELRSANILHRNIRHDNIVIKAGKPILVDVLWAVTEGEKFFYPFGIGGFERPINGSFSDVYSIGKIFEYINQHQYPVFKAVTSLMTAPAAEMRINDVEMLKSLFQVAYQSQISKNNNPLIDVELLIQVMNRDRQISANQRLENNLYEQISKLHQEISNLNIQHIADIKHIEGLISIISQKEQTIQAIYNSKSWKVALMLQKIIKLLLLRK